ncbi:helix-turn-helix domain-containing protein [Priestia megaterium]|uniref:helix-turn-helix domain-containing protein n=1 Tax=Priestia megaterium TaxID=1404 RepID=UPI00234F0229|nr:helix-turn-helix transcriptional regulator [Priestia megaterium]MDC7783900.1 helix-turn-helix transcriptional regulator [Priestia megaterium]
MIGDRIRTIRVQKRMTLSNLAEKANVTKSYLSNIERNISTNPTIEFVEKVALALNMKPETLLGWEQDENEISSLENSFSYMKKYLLTMDEEQLIELKDYIDFILWKRNRK